LLATVLILVFSLPLSFGVLLALYETPQACYRARETVAASAQSLRNLFDPSYRRSVRRSGRSQVSRGSGRGMKGHGQGSNGWAPPSGVALQGVGASPSPQESSAALKGGGLVGAAEHSAEAATILGGKSLKSALQSSKQPNQRDTGMVEGPRHSVCMDVESSAMEGGTVEGSAPPAESTAVESAAAQTAAAETAVVHTTHQAVSS
jgi:hypothetical protein